MVPKNLSFSVPDRAVLLLAPPLVFLARVFRPIIVALNATANGVLRLFRRRAEERGDLDVHARGGADDRRPVAARGRARPTRAAPSRAAFEFTTKKVQDVAVPMSALVTLPPSATPGDVERAVAQHGFSRYVLLGDDGEPDGYVHLKDVIDLDDDEFDDPMPPKRDPAAGLDLRRHRPRGRARDHAPLGTHVARAFDEDGAHDRRALPRGHHRGARRRGAGRHAARLIRRDRGGARSA